MLSIIIFIVSFTLAAPVQLKTADKVAYNIYKQYNLDKKFSFNVKSIEVVSDSGIDLIYIYHLNPLGFILVSADDRYDPYIGYSFDSNFKTENIPSNFDFFFNSIKSKIKSNITSNSYQNSINKDRWSKFSDSNYKNTRVRNVSPLIVAEFDQSGSWNNTLTAETGFNGPVGCVAVAMSQIMYYWGYPEQGTGSNTYIDSNLGELSVDFSTAFYDFDNMAPTYATNPSRLLLYHTGVSVNMSYENGGSGAQCQGVYPSAQDAMQRYFKYSDDIANADADNIDNINEFSEILKEQLDYSKPILFSGFSDSYGNGGHAWNVDGYQNNSFHCNWGWGGYNNGYFNLSTMGGFDTWQNALIDIIPEPYANPLALFAYDLVDNTVILIDISQEVNETQISSWNWDFGDGNTQVNSNNYAEHTYSGNGQYEVNLTVTNVYGYTSIAHTEIVTIGSALSGDINSDEVINVLDLVMLVNFVLGDSTPTNSELNVSDLNNDGTLNVLDIVTLVNLILDN